MTSRRAQCPICKGSAPNDCHQVKQSWHCIKSLGPAGATVPGWRCVALAEDNLRWVWQPDALQSVDEVKASAVLSLVSRPVELPPIEWFCEWILARGYLTKLSAPPRSFKSTVALTLAARIARGWDFYDWQTRPAKVLILDQDSPTRQWTQYALSLADPNWGETGNILMPSPDDPHFGKLTLPEHGQLLKETIQQNGIEVLKIDTWRAMTKRSGLDENSNSDMQLPLAALEDIARDCGCAVLIVHHTSKGGKRGAGAGVLESDVQIEFSLQRVQEEGTGRRFIRLKSTSSRFGEPDPMFFEVPPPPEQPGTPPPPLRAASGSISRCKVITDSTDEEMVDGKEAGPQEQVAQLLRSNCAGMSVQTLSSQIGKESNFVRTILRRLKEQGQIHDLPASSGKGNIWLWGAQPQQQHVPIGE